MIAFARTPIETVPPGYEFQPAPVTDDVNLPRIERAVREVLLAIGEDPDRDGLTETPRRVARAYREMFRGMREDAGVHLRRTFEQEHDEVILLCDIRFSSVCEHHLLPFAGKAHVAYLPAGGRVVGLSKLARAVEVFARRPQVQERLTDQIADALDEHLAPRGAAVLVEAQHSCMAARGVNQACSTMHTSALRGCFKTDRSFGAEVVSLLHQARR